MSDNIQKWDPLNLSIAYSALRNIDSYLAGTTASIVKGAIFYLAPSAIGTYSGWTAVKSITFYTSSNIPTQNVYHEFGHLLNNAYNGQITSLLGRTPVYYDGQYLFGGNGIGDINPLILDSRGLYDPNWPNDVKALQHTSSDPNEQWADIFANVVAGNIANSEQGNWVWTWLAYMVPRAMR